MEINFFLDNQQIEFDKLVTDIGVEIENVDDFDGMSSRRSSSLADIDDSLMEDDELEQPQDPETLGTGEEQAELRADDATTDGKQNEN
jgi:hypothetical protein